MNSDDNHQSADDALEPADDMFHPNSDEETLEEDNESPAAPADGNAHHLGSDAPQLDTDVDADELYSEGVGAASGVDDSEETRGTRAEPLEPEDERGR